METQNCNSYRKDLPLDHFRNCYAQTFRWCIYCRVSPSAIFKTSNLIIIAPKDRRCQQHNRRQQRKAALRARQESALRATSPNNEPARPKSPPPQRSTLARLRHCQQCRRHLAADAFDAMHANDADICMQCSVSLVAPNQVS